MHEEFDDEAADDDEREHAKDQAFERSEALRRAVLRKSIRRERARRRKDESIWSWLAAFGLVGWTVVVPTLLGLAAGRFLDNRVDSPISFTLTLLVCGAAIGIGMAWHWIRQESRHD